MTSAKDAIKREAFKRNALRVLRVWRDWYLFSEEYLNGLQATFLMEVHAKWRSLCPDQVKVSRRRQIIWVCPWLSCHNA